jgi:hypothetical protein
MTDRQRGKQRAKEIERPALLRRADQAVVAALVMLSLVGMAAYYVVQGGWRGGLIEIDRALPLEARFRVDLNQAEWCDGSTLKFVKRLVFKASELPTIPFDDRATPGIDTAESLLARWLADGPQHYTALFARAREAGTSESSLHRARVRMGLVTNAGSWSLCGRDC